MRTLALTLASCLALLAQDAQSERVFQFKNTVDRNSMHQVASAIHGVGTIRQLPIVNRDARTLTVTGSPAQLALVAWAFPLLDLDPRAPRIHSVSSDYLPEGNPDDAVRLIRFGHASSDPEFQAMASNVHSSTQIRLIWEINATHSILLRGQPQLLALAQWVCDQLDQTPGGAIDPNPQHFDLPQPEPGTRPEDANIRTTIFHVKSPKTIEDFLEMATALRAISGIRMVATYNSSKAIIVRSTPEKSDVGEWVLHELDRPSERTAAEYRHPGVDDLIGVLYLPATMTAVDFQASAAKIRITAGIRPAFAYNPTRALLVRGPAKQITQAQQMANDLVASVTTPK